MREPLNEVTIGQDHRDQMLKLVSRGFYKELVNYGVKREEIIRVASHLLDNLMTQQSAKGTETEYYDRLFTIADVKDEWSRRKEITVLGVSLRPLDRSLMGRIIEWLAQPGVRELFVPPFPTGEPELSAHFFETPANSYLSIYCDGAAVGIVGGEHVDVANGKLEMKKLVGDPGSRGRGIGKRATFAFLYYAFKILGLHKVYVHSRDINIRNINLNKKFGFVLEGIFFEDLRVDGKIQDIIRMALFQTDWTEIFSPAS